MLPQPHVSSCTLQRLPLYLSFLRSLGKETTHISSTEIAGGLGLNPVQVRKDLSAAGSKGRPRVGYEVTHLIRHLTRYLAGETRHSAVLVGLGHLGRALAAYGGFANYGFAIQAVFDCCERVVGRQFGAYQAQDIQGLAPFCRQHDIPVGIITVPGDQAQTVCDLLVEGGVRIIWNFAPAHLTVPGRVTVQDEDIAASLSLTAKRILLQPDTAAPSLQRGTNAHDRIY